MLPPDARADAKKKRKPGRPKLTGAYTQTIQLRLTAAQATHLAELAAEGNCHRSDVLRAAMSGVQFITGPAQSGLYRQTANLHTKLRQLQRQPDLSESAQAQLSELLTQTTEMLDAICNSF